MQKNGGIESAEDYPYKGTKGTCVAKAKTGLIVTDVNLLEANSEYSLMSAILVGPIVAAVSSSSPMFAFYSGGILNSKSC